MTYTGSVMRNDDSSLELPRALPEVEDLSPEFQSLIDGWPIGFFACDDFGRLTIANDRLLGWLGLAPSDIQAGGIAWTDIFRPEGDPNIGNLKSASGELLPVKVTERTGDVARPGNLSRSGIIERISSDETASRRLADLEARYEMFFKAAPAGIALIDNAGRVVEFNTAFGRLLDIDSDETRMNLVDKVASRDRDTVSQELRQVAAGAPPNEIEVQVDGADRVIALNAVRIEANGNGPLVMAYARDVTERRNLEAQFTQSQKMQAVGQLAGGIAHDFNNLLTAMIGFCDLLLMRHRPGEESFADIMQVKQNANRAANLVRQLLAFSRQQTMAPKVIDITDAIAELSHLLRRLIGETIELNITHGRDLGKVRVDQGQLEQVIINLAVNARDAMPDGGTLSIRTANMTIDDPVRRGAEVMPTGDYVLIEVADTGTGIAPEDQERIFEPFFSTKSVGQGTGLGLSTVYGIVRQTGGFVFVESAIGNGARFSIFLPRSDALQAAKANPVTGVEDCHPRDLTGRGTILLVEDEDAVRMFGARALRNKGYTVFDANSGPAALRIAEEYGGEFDVLVTDVVMPEMDGPAVIKAIRQKSPNIEVVCISGYAEDAIRQRLAETPNIRFLAKPFSLSQLAATVKDVLKRTR